MAGERFVEIPVELNRASLGDSPYPYVVISSVKGRPAQPAWVSREDITVDAQPVGSNLTGRLRVAVVEEKEKCLVVETKNKGRPVRGQVDRQTGRLASELEPVY